MLGACGSDGGDASDDVQGVAVAGSRHSALVFAAVDIDPSIRTSRVYRYDLASGTVRLLLPGESANPAIFAFGDEMLIFNRQGDAEKTVRTYDPRSASNSPSSATSLSGLADGDPLDVAPLVAGKSAILASGLGGKLQILDLDQGALTDLDSGVFSPSELRPVALYRSGDTLYVAHSGVDGLATGAGQGDGTQQLFKGKINGSEIQWTDADTATAMIDGQPLTATNPFAMVNRDADSAAIVGLCAASVGGCTAGSDRLEGGTVTRLKSFTSSFSYEFFNRTVDGPDSKTVYAHVRTASGAYEIVKLNVETQSAVSIHTFDDERLYGIAYDASTRTLFVGGVDGIKGTVTLYRDDQLVGSFELDGMLYSAAFAAK